MRLKIEFIIFKLYNYNDYNNNMPKKLTYKFVFNYFKQQECELLETEYVNSTTKLSYKCKNNHITSIIFSSFKAGHRCAKCAGSERLTYDFVFNYFKEQECVLLETEYINTNTKMKYRCNCGNESTIIFYNFKAGHRCSKCGCNEKHTFANVFNYFKKYDCELLESEYINSHTKMKYICECKNQSKITFKDFKYGQRCIKCNGNEKYTFEFVFNYFKKQNCELLETEYINVLTKMKYICECGNKSEITFHKFKQGQRCNLCKNKTEKKLFNWLQEQNCNVDTQVKFDWCKNINHLPFDFVLEELKLIIELDGPQHFIQISNWQSPEETQFRDALKSKLALENGYRMIRICQRIVLADKEDWENQLLEAINSKEKLIKIGSVFDQV